MGPSGCYENWSKYDWTHIDLNDWVGGKSREINRFDGIIVWNIFDIQRILNISFTKTSRSHYIYNRINVENSSRHLNWCISELIMNRLP